MEINLNKHMAKKLYIELGYIKTRKEHGLEAYEMFKTIPTEDFVALAEAYIELFKISGQIQGPDQIS